MGTGSGVFIKFSQEFATGYYAGDGFCALIFAEASRLIEERGAVPSLYQNGKDLSISTVGVMQEEPLKQLITQINALKDEAHRDIFEVVVR